MYLVILKRPDATFPILLGYPSKDEFIKDYDESWGEIIIDDIPNIEALKLIDASEELISAFEAISRSKE